MIKNQTGAKEEYSGIDVEIVKEITRRMNLELEIIDCPWKRCLWLQENGNTDIITSSYKKPEREAFLLYFDKPYLTSLPIAFYYKKDRSYKISSYDDLYGFNSIGVLRGASYFDRFDSDSKLKKYEVSSQNQLFPMIASGRIEIMAGYVPTENFRLIEEGYRDTVEKSVFEFKNPTPVYIALSKNSKFAGRLSEFNRINNSLLEEGLIQKIIDSYYKKYTP